jgi:MFS family permease
VTTKTPTSKGIVLALSCAAQFMVVLDIAIVNVALPWIQQNLGIEQSTLQWIVIANGLMLGGLLLLGGRMADQLGRRRMLLTGLTLFSSASLLAGVTGSAGLLIGARALRGFVAALLPPAALSILAVTFAEGAERCWLRTAGAGFEVPHGPAIHTVAGGRWRAPGRVGP